MPSQDELSQSEKTKLTGLARSLLGWAESNGREFPWRRKEASEYERIVVEVMLQRTTATAVSRFYEKFFARYPDWSTLAIAESNDLECFLKPLGLWRRRANSLLGLAAYAREREGRFPRDPSEHKDIPAVGQYVSNAILIFQHGQAAPLLDVNMARVIERFVHPRRLADIRYDPWLQAAARWFSKGEQSAERNWAMLDFAAVVCKSRNPDCPTCPVNSRCSYWAAANEL